jgi:hypothetical protein
LTEYEIFKNQTLKLLGEIISYESAKPDDEADFDLIEDCEKMMCDLLEGSATLSDEEIRIRIEKVKQKTQVSKPKKKVHRGFSRVAAAALCAVLVLCISVCAVCVINPEIREGIMKAMGISVGESVDVNGITFVNNGDVTKYQEIETLLVENGLDIMYPQTLPENVWIEAIYVTKQSTNMMTMIFSNNVGLIDVYLNGENIVDEIKENADKVAVANKEFYVKKVDNYWIALISDELYTYYISYMNQSGLYIIMEGFNK